MLAEFLAKMRNSERQTDRDRQRQRADRDRDRDIQADKDTQRQRGTKDKSTAAGRQTRGMLAAFLAKMRNSETQRETDKDKGTDTETYIQKTQRQRGTKDKSTAAGKTDTGNARRIPGENEETARHTAPGGD